MNPQKSAAQVIPLEPAVEGPFYIAATQAAGRPLRTLKYGDTFAVFDSRGDIAAASGGSAGLFHLDTRYLSRLEVLVNGAPPLLLGSNLRDDNSALSVDLTNPDLVANDRILLEKDSVHILRTTFLWRETAYQRLRVRNYGDRPIDLQLSILFANDFADLFEVRGSHRERRGAANAKLHDDEVVLSYHGLDAKLRRTTLTFDPPRSRRDTTDFCRRQLRSVVTDAALSARPDRRAPRASAVGASLHRG
jgi:glycogen debranching enzyme